MDIAASPTVVAQQDGVCADRAANHSYFPALDGLRALAFLMVFGVHYVQLPWGWTGVDVFFVLSGFLITGILYDTQDHPYRARNFYVRRTLRIFPLYYGLMLLLVLFYPLCRWEWNWTWLVWPAYVGNFMRGLHPLADRPSLKMLGDFAVQSRTFAKVHFSFGHFWSLCVEEQFYLLWPWVVFWVRDRSRLMWVCAVCVVACPLMRVAGNHMLPQYMLDQEVLYRWTPFHVDALLLGGWVALARRGRFAGRLLLGARAGSGILLGALALWLALNQWRVQGPGGYVYPAWKLTWGLTFADVLSACLIVTVIENGSIAFRIFNLRPLRWLRRISYGAYVFHDILHGEYSAFITNFYADPRGWVTAGFGLACTLVLAWASFRWYEMPFIRLKERWTRGAEGEGKAVAAG